MDIHSLFFIYARIMPTRWRPAHGCGGRFSIIPQLYTLCQAKINKKNKKTFFLKPLDKPVSLCYTITTVRKERGNKMKVFVVYNSLNLPVLTTEDESLADWTAAFEGGYFVEKFDKNYHLTW